MQASPSCPTERLSLPQKSDNSFHRGTPYHSQAFSLFHPYTSFPPAWAKFAPYQRSSSRPERPDFLRTLPNIVIPTEAARLFLPRRILARRVAQWRDLLLAWLLANSRSLASLGMTTSWIFTLMSMATQIAKTLLKFQSATLLLALAHRFPSQSGIASSPGRLDPPFRSVRPRGPARFRSDGRRSTPPLRLHEFRRVHRSLQMGHIFPARAPRLCLAGRRSGRATPRAACRLCGGHALRRHHAPA